MRKFTPSRIALLLAGLYCVFRGIMYTPLFYTNPLPEGIAIIDDLTSIWLWVALWIVVGIIAVVSALMGTQKRVAWGAVAGVMVGWGTAYSYGIFTHIAQGEAFRTDLVMTVKYLFIASLIVLLTPKDEKE